MSFNQRSQGCQYELGVVVEINSQGSATLQFESHTGHVVVDKTYTILLLFFKPKSLFLKTYDFKVCFAIKFEMKSTDRVLKMKKVLYLRYGTEVPVDG